MFHPSKVPPCSRVKPAKSPKLPKPQKIEPLKL